LRSKFSSIFLSSLLVFSLGVNGCAKHEPPPRAVGESLEFFEKKCREDYELIVKTRLVGSTLWVYLPTKNPIFDYEAQKQQAGAEDAKKPKFIVDYVDTKFADKAFNLEFDIVDKKKSSDENYGFSSSYTDSYLKMQNNLFTALSEAFFGIKAKKNEVTPEFAVIVIADIKKGIEARITFYLRDFERFMVGDLPYDEYMKRFLPETKGSESFIGDETGTHLEYTEVKMPDFLARQITNRINFKFQHSDFPPDMKSFDNTLVGIVSDTLRYYEFKDYKELSLNNLRADKKYIFTPAQVATFTDDVSAGDKAPDAAGNGKLIHIIFEDGKAKIKGEEESSPEKKDQSP
jgi:hypothetical protein